MGSTRPSPAVFQHASQTQWGRGVVASHGEDRTTYMFENGGPRTFMNGHQLIQEVSLPQQEREALATALLRRVAALTAPPKKKATAAKAAAAKKAKAQKAAEAVPEITFERQLAIFKAAYPGGFEDPKFIAEERGSAGGPERRKDAGITLARDVLRAQKLDAAITKGAFAAIFTAATQVLTAFESLSLPKPEKPAFERIPEGARPRFAKALRDMLHGDGAYAPRFDAFVETLEMGT